MNGWRHIATAPRDGSDILVYSSSEGYDVVRFEAGYEKGHEWMDAQGYSVYGIVAWRPLPEFPAGGLDTRPRPRDKT